MEDNSIFELKTSWPFPIIHYSVNTSYIVVRKASGIAYILLQLISSSENNSEKLVVTLKNLGVPGDIHYIFAGELALMINYGIIQMRSGRDFGTDLIGMYQVSDFEITELGKKLFKEGTIPTGENNTKKLNVYYDVSQKDTKNKFEQKLSLLENSTLNQNCVGDIVLNNQDVEMYITENMSKYGFRKGERIAEFNHEEPEILVYKIDEAVMVRISAEGLQIQATNKERDVFIHKYYSPDVVTKIIDVKKKFHFADFLVPEVREYDFTTLDNISKLYMPSQIGLATNVKSQLSLSDKCEMRSSECTLPNNESIDLMRKCDINGVACYFENGNLYSIIPGRFHLNIDGYSGKCAINLIAVRQLGDDMQQQLMKEIFFKCIDTTEPLKKCNVIKKLTQISKCKDYLEQYSNTLIHKMSSSSERIDLFIKLNDEFSKEAGWTEYSKVCAENLFEELCTQVSVEGFAAQNIMGKKLNKVIGLNEIEYISRVSRKLIEDEDEVIAYEALESSDFSVDVILSVVNVFKLYCRQIIEGIHISGNSKLSGQFILLGQSLSELRELTGIDNPYEDSAELEFNYDRFCQVMVTFIDSMKKLEKYKAYDIDKSFDYLLFFKERLTELKEMVTIEKEATKNPKNIDKKFIEQRLKKSRYKDAICDLHVRLQYELNRLFNTNDVSTFDLLSEPRMKDFLNEDEIDDMHALRKCRNGFQHPKDKRDITYSEKIIREWCVVVEKLGGISCESRSEN